jgi:hypothetical protein
VPLASNRTPLSKLRVVETLDPRLDAERAGPSNADAAG